MENGSGSSRKKPTRWLCQTSSPAFKITSEGTRVSPEKTRGTSIEMKLPALLGLNLNKEDHCSSTFGLEKTNNVEAITEEEEAADAREVVT